MSTYNILMSTEKVLKMPTHNILNAYQIMYFMFSFLGQFN